MPDAARLLRLLDGTLDPEAAEGPPLDEDELDQVARRAVVRTYARDHPPPPLDRLDEDERSRFLS